MCLDIRGSLAAETSEHALCRCLRPAIRQRSGRVEPRGKGKPFVERELFEAVDGSALPCQCDLIDRISAGRFVDDARNQLPGTIEIPPVGPKHLRPDETAHQARIEVARGPPDGLSE